MKRAMKRAPIRERTGRGTWALSVFAFVVVAACSRHGIYAALVIFVLSSFSLASSLSLVYTYS